MAQLDKEDGSRSCHPADQRVLDTLRSHGDSLQSPRLVHHYLYFPAEAAARKAAGLLQEDGYAAEVQPGATGSDWLTLASHRLIPTAEAIASARQEMESLADSLEGDYDGWETELITRPM